MQLEDIELTSQPEDWVLAAFAKASKVGSGTFSLVLDADQDGYVVKLTRSEADYQALVHFGSTGPHFPRVIKHAINQGRGEDCSYHAIMLEKLTEFPLEASDIADHINRQEVGKHNPSGLLKAAENMENGNVNGYPASLAEALRALGT